MEQKKGFFEMLDGKSAMLVGLVGGVLSLGTLGFVVLGVMTLKNGLPSGSAGYVQTPPSQLAGDTGGAQPSGPVPPVASDDHIRGDKNAKVTMIEYSDYECPFCQRFHPTTQSILSEFGNQVRLVFRHFPLTSIHPNAQRLAEASECMAEFGGDKAFWAFTDAVFLTSDYSEANLKSIAQKAGVNTTKFSECVSSGKYAQNVQQESDGGYAAGVSGTPGTFIIDKNGNAEFVSGAVPYDVLKAAVQKAINS